MLDEARRRHERGEDVVVAAIEPQQSEDLQALLIEVAPNCTQSDLLSASA